jgi:hypothetical protein
VFDAESENIGLLIGNFHQITTHASSINPFFKVVNTFSHSEKRHPLAPLLKLR